MAAATDTLLTEREVADRLRVGRSTVAGWRQAKKGPPARKLGGTLVRYSAAELEEWISQQ